ncbi:MAG: penicillin-binding protein activator LpoB [Desulfurivibrionaceae bacterium]
MKRLSFITLLFLACLALAGCAVTSSQETYKRTDMNFGMLRSVAVLPFQNLTSEEEAAARVRDTFSGMLLATEALEVLPPGEMQRGLNRVNPENRHSPTLEEIKELGSVLKVDAVITGTLREYETLRSGASEAHVISLSLQMLEVETGTIIWSASSTRGGITMMDRLFGGGGEAKNPITRQACNELLDRLFD